jgi:hypothetical protein
MTGLTATASTVVDADKPTRVAGHHRPGRGQAVVLRHRPGHRLDARQRHHVER